MEATVARFGIILRTERYEECVAFYRDILGLPVWYVKEQLVCLHYGSGYLMVEKGGQASHSRKEGGQSPHILRFDVSDIAAAATALRKQGVAVELFELDWGSIATFADPDGNPCELKNADDPFFA